MSNQERKLICGPYVGEFGWELFFWSGYCRALSRHFDQTIVITRPGRNMLYEDFANVENYSPPPHGVADCENNSAFTDEEFKILVEKYGTDASWFRPFPQDRGPFGVHWAQPVWVQQVNGFLSPEYISRDRKNDLKEKIIIIHARNRADVRPVDNPPIEMLNALVQVLKSKYRVVTIGQRGNSMWVEGTEDWRNQSLSAITALMDQAVCVVGTTSGPMHLASLMGCPVITWQWDYEKMWYRFSSAWNPHDSNLILIKTKGERDLYHNHPSHLQLTWAIEKIQEDGFNKMQVESDT